MATIEQDTAEAVCEECGEVHEADLANEGDYREVGK
jgi:transcription initiation factor TFIIIB Brf1 subunit/transcription initiation factor TFIIB